MESRLNLNMELVEKARASASKVADDVQEFIDAHTTVTVERAVCRLLGIDGVNDVDVPLPNVVVDHLHEKGILPGGAAFYVGNAMAEYGIDPQAVAEKVAAGEVDLTKVPVHTAEEVRAAIMPVVNATLERINTNVATRNEFLKEFGDKEAPICTSLLLPVTSTRISSRLRPAPSRVPISSLLSVPPVSPCWTMCLTVLPPRASAVPTPPRRTSA